MKKSILLILVLFIGLFSFASPAFAVEYAYSVGTKYAAGLDHAGDDFTPNVLEAANAYGWLKNYTSFYSLKPDYAYMNNSNYLGGSSVYFINGHATPLFIDVAAFNSANYKTGITTYSSGTTTTDGFKYAGLDGRNMSKTKLISFVGCKTGQGTNNLPTKAVAQGAKSAVGFKNDITSRFNDGPKWVQKYNYVLGSGYSVKKAIESATTKFPNSDLATSVMYKGNGNQTLGVLDTKSLSMAKSNPSLLLDKKDVNTFLEMSKTIEEEYKIIYSGLSDDSYKIESKEIIDFITETIKKEDSSFDISDYKVQYNMINEDEGYGFVFFKYYIDGQIETNKVYMATIDNNRITSITLAGVLKDNLISTKITNVTKTSLKQKVQNFESNKTSILKQNDKRSLLSNNISKKISKESFEKNVDNFTEKYYYDYNSGKLYYQLNTYEVDSNGLSDGYELRVELS